MKKSIMLLCCLVALGFQSKADNHTPPPPNSQQQKDDDKRRADEERRRQEAEDRAWNAEAHQTVNAVGTSEADCMSSLQMKVATATPSVIASCNNDAHPIRECFVVSQNTSYPGAVSPVSADSEYDEYKSDEATCRATAADNAESKAVADCQAKYGVTCAITSQGFVFDYHTKERRRYLIFGPKDLHQVCDAAASAAPIAPYTTQCSVEIVAKSHY